MEISKRELIAKYDVELLKKRNNMPYDESLINSIEQQLKEIGAFEEAVAFVESNIEKCRNFKEALNAANDFFNILKDFTIFKIGKFDEELVKIKEVLKKQDEYYNARISLYEKLLELPKYAKLDEEEKIKLAMKIGALDIRDLSHNKGI